MSCQRSLSHLASSSPHWTYEVFLSFRGEDTRKNFTDHLYAALERRGIIIFKDDKELEKGKSISPKLCKAIEESRMSIIVFSKNYASSTWCLDELVKILQCMKMKKQIVIPIFYDVDPSVVRKQTQSFQKAFANHLEAFKDDIERVLNWKTALEEVANLTGWDLKDRHESKFIQDIVEHIAITLGPTTLRNCDNDLVGLNSHLERLMGLVSNKDVDDVSMIGIYGMGGIGKTTIARIVYEKISYQFEASSFLANVRETSKKSGLISLQKQLLLDILIERGINIKDAYGEIRSRLCNKKVLIVIDDVNDIEQLNKLVGKHEWFGSGSRIIITTRDKHLLVTHKVDEMYEAKKLDVDEALQFFNSKAFKNNQPLEKFQKLSRAFVEYAGGLPLALKVLGSFLFDKTIEEWESALRRLGKDSERNIFDCLQISFDELKETEKKIFLDIACFFNGASKDHVIRILDGCDFDPIIGLRVLQDKCLLTISDSNTLWMHDLLQELGQKIVQKESLNEPGKRSRLWEEMEALNVLMKNTGTDIVEGLMLDKEVQVSGNAKVFSKMTNLRLLKISGEKLSKGLEYLSNELRLLEWNGYGLKSLPSSFHFNNIVELKMHHSCIEELWKKTEPLNKLKVISLSHSKNLKETPDFTKVPNLEKLILEGCTRLCEIHPSLLVHRKLIELNLKNCSSLTTLPSDIEMKSLKKLILSGCRNLKMSPEFMSSMECLSELFLDGTSIKEMPMSIDLLTGLVLLNLEDCKNLTRLPSNINELKSLKTLKLSGTKLENVPENLWQAESLEELDIRGTATGQPKSNSWYSHFPFSLMSRKNSAPMTLTLTSVSGLCSLKRLTLGYCNLRTIPNDICNLVSLKCLNLRGNDFVSLPASMCRLSKVRELYLDDCKRLQSLPELPSKLYGIGLANCDSLETLGNALKLTELRILNCRNSPKLSYDSSDFVAHAMLKERLWDPDMTSFVNDKQSCPHWYIIVPRNEIPRWFRHQNDGASVKIGSLGDSKITGYLVCTLFSMHNLQPWLEENVFDDLLQCNLFPKFGNCFQSGQEYSDHVWVLYCHRARLEELNCFEDNFEVKFYSSSKGQSRIEVKRCGAHPIYEKEVNEPNHQPDQCSNSIFGNLIEYSQDVVPPTEMDVAATKRSLADYERVEPSGGGNSDDDEPQPKRQKKPEIC